MAHITGDRYRRCILGGNHGLEGRIVSAGRGGLGHIMDGTSTGSCRGLLPSFIRILEQVKPQPHDIQIPDARVGWSLPVGGRGLGW